MAINKGKKWEVQFEEDWKKCFPNTLCFRLPDQQSYYKGASSNPCDYFCFPGKKLFLMEIKSHKGNTFPFSDLRQYELLKSYKDLKNCICGIILWFIEHNKVIYVHIEELIKMKERDNLKSINIKMLQTKEYEIIEIPCEIKRIYPKCNYIELVKKFDGVE